MVSENTCFKRQKNKLATYVSRGTVRATFLYIVGHIFATASCCEDVTDDDLAMTV